MRASSASPDAEAAEPESSDAVHSGVTQRQRVIRFTASLLIFVFCTYYGVFRVDFPAPGLSRGHPFTARWWLWPLEFNSASRVNHIDPTIDFNCITATPDRLNIWMGGQAGMILHSADRGRTWTQLRRIDDQSVTVAPAPAKPTPPNKAPVGSPSPSASPPPKKASLDRTQSRRIAMAGANERDEWIRVSAEDRGPQQQTGQMQNRAAAAPPQAQPQANPPPKYETPTNLRVEPVPTESPSEQSFGVQGSDTTAGATDVPAQEETAQLLTNTIIDLSFVNPSVGYALTQLGELLCTHDGGNSWQLLPALTKEFEHCNPRVQGLPSYSSRIQFIDERRGVAVGDCFMATFDGGQTWISDPKNEDRFTDFVLTEGLRGWAVGPFEGVQEFFADEKQIRFSPVSKVLPTATSSTTYLNAITKTTGSALFACGDGGLLVTFRNNQWEPLENKRADDLHRIVFPSQSTGYAISDTGLILATNDGGKHWEPRPAPALGTPTAIFFRSENEGLLAVTNGTVFSTNDGGRHWAPIVVSSAAPLNGFHFWLPAPWYLLALCFLIGFVRRIPDETPTLPITGIAGLLLSDKPIEAADADYLGFRQIALGLSNYLRNNATNPPLTIAVTGDWGMGKSSLMNLLLGDLESYGFKAVKFNAWHHQTEESLLAALLENVRTQAIPSIVKPEGIVFRVKLLWLRARKNILAFLLVVAGAAFCVGYFAADIRRLTEPPSALLAFFQHPMDMIDKLQIRKMEIGKFLVVAITTIGALLTFLKGFRAFGADPSSLLASKSNAAKSKDLRAQTSFRYQFSQDFREVTESLNPLSMVLFVDDLDRCRPEQVYDMLESINFLVSCGDCFVVMGFARRRVERCVGLVFEKVAAERPNKPNEPELTDLQKREKFAKDYLEKLINIEVAVPIGSADQIRQLLVNKPLDTRTPSRMEMADRWIRKWGSSLFLALIACVVGWIALSSSMQLFPRGEAKRSSTDLGPPPPPPLAKAEATPSNQSPEEKAREDWIRKRDEANAVAERKRQSAVFTPASKVGLPLWIIFLGAGTLTALGIIRLSRRPGAVVEDSPGFVSALNEWGPFLIQNTEMNPRAIKRFVNRVRYFAMMDGQFRPAPRWWEKLFSSVFAMFAGVRMVQPPLAPPPLKTPEELLVAIAAIYERRPQWFDGDLNSFKNAVAGTPDKTIFPVVDAVVLLNALTPKVYERFKQLRREGVEMR